MVPVQTSDQFETLGYFEELIELHEDGSTGKCIGTRLVGGPDYTTDRPLGYAGRKKLVLTEPFEVVRGMRGVTVKASEAKPVRCITYLQRLCGPRIP